MINYINIEKKKLVGRSNQVIPPLIIDYSTEEKVDFQLINSQSKLLQLESTSGLYFAASLKMGEPASSLLFLSKDYEVDEAGVISFLVDTYTIPYLQQIKKKNTEVNLEIGQILVDEKRLLLRDYGLANPRVYVEGLSPAEIESHDYYTKEEIDEMLAISGVPKKLSELENDVGFVTSGDVEDQISAALSGIELSGYATEEELEDVAATIPTKTSDLQNDSDFATSSYVDAAVSGKQDLITAQKKLSYALLSGTPAIPTKTSELINDSSFATSSYVDSAVSGKQDLITAQKKLSFNLLSSVPAFATQSDIDAAISGKQDLITAQKKLSYALLSGTPTIPTKTSDITNDSGFTTTSYVDSAVSGKQDLITAQKKLSYALLSGTPTIPTKTSDLINDSSFATSSYVDSAVSGKLDAPSGGISGQVLTKTENGEAWMDPQGGSGGSVAWDDITGKPDFGVLDIEEGTIVSQEINITPSSDEALHFTVSSPTALNANGSTSGKVEYAEVVLDIALGASVQAGTGVTFADTCEDGKRNICIIRWYNEDATLFVVHKEDLPVGQ